MHISFDRQHSGVMDLSTKVTYGGSGFAALWGLFTVEQWIGIGGLLVAIIGLTVKTILDLREEKRREERHNAYMLNQQPTPDETNNNE